MFFGGTRTSLTTWTTPCEYVSFYCRKTGRSRSTYILGNAVLDSDPGEAVDAHADEAAVACNIDAQVAVLEHSWHVDVEDTLGCLVVVRGLV